MNDKLASAGYHTASVSRLGKRHAVTVAPFTDRSEAEYVRQSIIKDTGVRLSLQPVYK